MGWSIGTTFSLLSICYLLVYSNWLYLLGFFPQKPPGLPIASWADYSEGDDDSESWTSFRPAYGRQVRRTVLMVVDGMRRDMIGEFPTLNEENLARRRCNAVSLAALASAPTVTMPRIKAMMTGDIPAFVDFFSNMDAGQFSGDSLVRQWYNSGMNITMFGDETWGRLFGDKFLRHDGVSFLVNEHVIVDLNVSRHLEVELKQNDWQVMILHFGGVDHIGHLYGPFSRLMPGKLAEMDANLAAVVDGLRKSGGGSGDDWLVVLTSDHGQSDAGGHGGPTLEEVSTPLVFISPMLRKNKRTNENVKQIDLTPSLAFLTGVPIPSMSSGVMIWPLLSSLSLSKQDQLRILNANSRQLSRILEFSVPDHSSHSSYIGLSRAQGLHNKWVNKYKNSFESEPALNAFEKVRLEYMTSLEEASSAITESLTTFNTTLVYLSILFGIFVVFNLLALVGSPPVLKGRCRLSHTSHIGVNFNNVNHLAVCAGVFLSSSCLLMLANSATREFTALSDSTPVLSWATVVALTVTAVSSCNTVVIALRAFSVGNVSRIGAELLVMTVYCLFLCSTSFIEEEHQTVYFLATTALVLMTFERARHRLLVSLTKKRDDAEVDAPNIEFRWREIAINVLPLALFRHIRAWNQTGNKWLSYPDIGDWLLLPENSTLHSFVFLLSSAALLICLVLKFGRVVALSCSGAVFLAVGYHVSAYKIGSLSEWVGMDDLGVSYAAYLHYYLLLLLLIVSVVWVIMPSSHLVPRAASFFKASLLAYSLLLQNQQDFIVICGLVVTSESLRRLLDFWRDSVSPFRYSMIVSVLGRAAFFALGNSNSFTTVDIQTAYTGLTHHYLPLVVLNLFITMFAGPLIVYLDHLKLTGSSRSDLDQMTSSMLLFRALSCVTVLACSWFQRYHIMTWTVFSPKVIYECGWAVFDVAIVIFMCLYRQFF